MAFLGLRLGNETQLRRISGLDKELTDAENGSLNPLGINCLRKFPVHGEVAWWSFPSPRA